MLHVLTSDNEIVNYSQSPVWFKPAQICPCPCCDIDCKECSSLAECSHTTHDGGAGGFCVFTYHEETDTFDCLGHHTQVRGMSDCACDVAFCEHTDALQAEQRKRQPGARQAGVQATAFKQQYMRGEHHADGK